MNDDKLRICLRKNIVRVRDTPNSPVNENVENIQQSHIQFNTNDGLTIKSELTNGELEPFINFFNIFEHHIERLQLKHKETDEIFALSENLVMVTFEVFRNILKKQSTVDETLDEAFINMKNRFRECSTRGKRHKKKTCDPFYVQPDEKAIGVKWKATIHQQTELVHHTLIQEKFIYVSIVEQLNALFRDARFTEMYLKYNVEQRNMNDDVIRNYSSGSNYKNSVFFRKNPNAMHLQLGIDECQFACPVKTRTVKQKLLCIYLQIKNLPQEFLSKLNTIQLVAVCKAQNLDQADAGLSDVLDVIVEDLRKLEEFGIEIGNNQVLRGALINIAYDNLGGNILYGLIACFIRDFYCRHCECNKLECENLTIENSAKVRNKSDYMKYMDIIAESNKKSKKVNFDQTKGFKSQCSFNKLQEFHILDNNSVDLMHDVPEGIIPYLLHHFFLKIIDEKIITAEELIARVRDFNYGFLNRENKPSPLSLKKKNLGQSASQSFCLFTNIAFILIDYREQLKAVWTPIETLLQIVQILYSREIPQCEVDRLEQLISHHMESFKGIIKAKFIPKYHFLLHYPNVIRKMGPPTSMWMMRYEAKHKTLTDIAKKSNNFVNLAKTIAQRHQDIICIPSKIYSDDIQVSHTSTLFLANEHFEKYHSVVGSDASINVAEIKTIKFLSYNGFQYRSGLIMVIETDIFEIMEVLSTADQYFLILQPYHIVRVNAFCNSLVISKTETANFLFKKLDGSINKKTYHKTICQNEITVFKYTIDLNLK